MSPRAEADRPRVIVVGAGFAGFHCARALDRRLADKLEVVLVDPADHMLYSALLQEVAGGVLDSRHIAIPLAASLRSTRVLLGSVTAIDHMEQTCRVRGVDGHEEQLAWDRLVLNPGSVTRTFGITGVLEHAYGLKTLAEATYLRERILGQLQLAATAPDAPTRNAHGSFVVVGGGFTGLELAANGLRLARAALEQHPELDPKAVRWTVVEAGPSVLGEFPARLARAALERLRKLGVDIRLAAPVAEVAADHVKLNNGEALPTRTVVWTAGVTPSPLISQLGLATDDRRLIVDDRLQSREHAHVYALGDAAAVPDVTHPGKLAAQTAQNAQRQGIAAARNIAASLGHGKARRYQHHSLGLTVDLTGRNVIATPFGLQLTGLAAKLAGRLYHLWALPSGRLRVLSDWGNGLITGRHIVRLGLVDPADATIYAEANGPDEHAITQSVDANAA